MLFPEADNVDTIRGERKLSPMNGIESPSAVWLLISVQAIGLVSAWLARVSEGSSHQALSHSFFLVCLAIVGLAAVAGLAIGPGYWLMAATTLATMILIAVCDFRADRGVAIG
jgi:hypothetical protein